VGKFVITPHFRLQEWVAEEKGYFKAEGLDYEFRDNYGPVHKAFAALDEAGREGLWADLVDLAVRRDRRAGPAVAIPSEYLEAVAIRGA